MFLILIVVMCGEINLTKRQWQHSLIQINELKNINLPLFSICACTLEQHPSLPKLGPWLSVTVTGKRNLPWKKQVV